MRSPADARTRLDFWQAASGALLALFVCIHLLLEGSVVISPALTNGIQGFFRGIGDLKITLRSSMLSMAARVPSAALLVLYFHMEIEALPWSYAFGWFLMLVYEVPTMLRFLRSGTMERNE